VPDSGDATAAANTWSTATVMNDIIGFLDDKRG
jgi:hypothetical protein